MTATIAPKPELLALEPDTVFDDDGQLIIAVKGSGFTMHSQVFFDGEPQATGMLSQDMLAVPLSPGLLGPGTIDVTVSDLNGHITPALQFIITEKQDVQE